MNIENIRRLANHLRQTEVQSHFDMSNYFHSEDNDLPVGQSIHTCGTVACIAGHAAILAKPSMASSVLVDDKAHGLAASFLDLNGWDADDLFTPDTCEVIWSKITASIAADVLDHLADTGQIVWPDEVKA